MRAGIRNRSVVTVHGEAWHRLEGTDVPWHYTVLGYKTTFQNDPHMQSNVSPDGTGVSLAFGVGGHYNVLQRGVGVGLELRTGPGKTSHRATPPTVAVISLFRTIAERLTRVTLYASKYARDPLQLAQLVEHSHRPNASLTARLAEARDWDRMLAPMSTVPGPEFRRRGLWAPLRHGVPAPEAALYNPDPLEEQVVYHQSPYMSTQDQLDYLRGEFQMFLLSGSENGSSIGVAVAREARIFVGMRARDSFGAGATHPEPLDAFASIIKLKLGVRLSKAIYNWRVVDPMDDVATTASTYLWYPMDLLNGIVYMHGAAKAQATRVLDVSVWYAEATASGELWRYYMTELSVGAPHLHVPLTSRYFDTETGAFCNSAPAGGAEASTVRGSWALVRRNLFLLDKVQRSLTSPGFGAQGSVRLDVKKVWTSV